MSLHHTNNVKERRIPTPCSTLLSKDEPSAEDLVTAEANRPVRRCGDTPLGGAFDSVKPFFALFFQSRVKPAEMRGSRRVASALQGTSTPIL